MKDKLDRFILLNYDKLIRITQKKITYFEVKIQAELVLAEAYIYVSENLPEREEDIPRYLVQFINTELMYPMSKTRRKERICEGVDFDIDPIAYQSIEAYIEEMENRQLLDEFKNKLDRLEQIVWEVYSEKGIRTSRELANHFNITHTTGYLTLKEVLDKFKQFYNEYED